jgi:hypothetical protein
MSFIDRIGIDGGRKLGIEVAIAWAARHGVKAIHVQRNLATYALESLDEARCTRVLDACATTGVSIALHTLSSGAGFRGPYACGWGTVDQMFEGRKYRVEKARDAGVT